MSAYVQTTRNRTFQLDFSGYIPLIETSYNEQMALDRSLRPYIPFSAYQYYCIIALWKRLYHIVSARGELCLENMHLTQALNFDYPLPADVQSYLSGIGDIRDSSGRDCHLSIQSLLTDQQINGPSGSFGIIDAGTRIFYETLPAPIISVLKMQADLNPEAPLDWDLPVGLRPEDPAATLPTANLLGWHRKARLSGDQKATLEEAGITREQPVRHVANIPLFASLIINVGKLLEQSKCEVTGCFPTSTSGSNAQVAYITRSRDDNAIEPLRNIAAKSAKTNCYTQLVGGMASSSAKMKYRIQRVTENELDSLGYRFQAEAIPRAWLANSNKIFEFGIAQQLWNNPEFFYY